jgi:DNA invertase Pin-like site-specific DNA recombinase
LRYGVIRSAPDLPTPAQQRRGIETAGCDVLLEQPSFTANGRNALRHRLRTLRRGDELLLHDLAVLGASTGALAVILRRLFEAGVAVRLTGGPQIVTLAPVDPIPRVLAVLADHESARPEKPLVRRRAHPRAAQLTQHQIRYARDMHRRGHSLRAIGLLFQLAPTEIAAVIRARDVGEAGSDGDADRTPLASPSP